MPSGEANIIYFSSLRTNCSYQRFTDVWLRQILDLYIVIYCPFIGFKKDYIRKGHKMTGEHFYEVGDAGHGHSSRCVNRLKDIEDPG